MCVLEGEEGGSGGGGDGGRVGVVFVVPSAVSLRTAETEQLSGRANDWRNRARVVLKLIMVKIRWLLSVNLSEARDNYVDQSW